MKPYVINKSSWHYKLISRGKTSYWHIYSSPKDFCSYWRMVVFKILGYIFITCFLTLFLAFLGYNIYLDPIPVLGGMFIASAIIALSVFLAISLEKLKEKKRMRDYEVEFEGKQEGLIAMKYRAWKEKTCPMVEYKE